MTKKRKPAKVVTRKPIDFVPGSKIETLLKASVERAKNGGPFIFGC